MMGKNPQTFRVAPSGRDSILRHMKFTTPFTNTKCVLVALAISGFCQFVSAGEPTALQLVKDANEYVGKDVRDQVIQIRSEKSIGTLVPNIWYVVYYDKDATFKTAEVKFGAGQKLDVKHPMRQPFAYINDKNLLDRKNITVDSDKAIKIATAEPLLAKLNIRATQMWLERIDGVDTWRVRLWAQKLRHPDSDADIGQVFINADDGKVIKDDLHIDRVD
jgi:hypothetical protein